MKGLELMKKEFQNIFRNRILLISLIVVLFIPVIYGGMFLWAFWDPYAKMDKLPVAVVNNDKGAIFEGEKIKIGDDLVKNLKENKSFGWHFVSEKEAKKGLKDQTYYMAVIIPEDFSENATTVLDENPKPMRLIYEPNESYNFLSAQIGDSAIKQVKEKMANAVTETYAETIFDKIVETADGLKQAGDGAEQLKDGIVQAKDGAVALKDGLDRAKDGSSQLNNGARSAKAGANVLKENLKLLAEKSITFEKGLQSASSGANALEEGVRKLGGGFEQMQLGNRQLLAGAKKAESGANQLADYLNQTLSGMKSAQQNLPLLVEGTRQLGVGAESLAESAGQWAAGASQVSSQVDQGFSSILDQLNQMISQMPDSQEKAALESLKNGLEQIYNGNDSQPGLKAAMAQLVAGASRIQAGAGELSDGTDRLVQQEQELGKGFDQLVKAQEQLASGAKTLASGETELVYGLTTFGQKLQEGKSGVDQLLSGSTQLANGVGQLYSGSGQLADGSGKLANGANELASGLEQLASGTDELSNGMNQLADGSGQLTDGLNRLSDGSGELASKLKEGADKAKSIHADDNTYHMIADPVEKDDDVLYPVPNYGTGFSPYFMSLGLYVGALILSIVFTMRKPAGEPKSGFSWFIEKFVILAIIAVVQSLLLDAVLLGALGLEVQSVPKYILFTIITSITFVSLIQFLVTPLGNVGRFLAVLLLIAQLTTCAGTFPKELLPGALQKVNRWLPMTYSIKGFKAAVSSGDFSFMWQNAGILFLFTLIFATGTFLYFRRAHKRGLYQEEVEAPLA